MIEIRNRVILAIASVVIGILLLAPTITPQSFGPGWISKPLSLGLDLRGGAHVVYRVKKADAVKSHLQGIGNTLRSDLRADSVGVSRVVATDNRELELYSVSSRSADKIKAKADAVRELTYVRTDNDGERTKLVYSIPEQVGERIERDAVIQAIETLRNRVDTFGVAEPIIQQIGTDRIMLQMPGETRVEKVKALVGKVAKLEFRLVAAPGATNTLTLKDRDGKPVEVEEQVLMTGSIVKQSRIETAQGQIEIGLQFTAEGGQTFGRVTSDNVGRLMAIIMDGVVYSSPRINEPIWGGAAQITGHFSAEEAKQLVTVLRSGALPAPLEVVEERTVGPSLGAESIRKGVYAILLGFAFIIVFMVGYYRKAGAVAVVCLALNLFFLLAILAAFGATLTLPGLAGLALTVGMAVDSSVIIFERIRDELRNGSTRDAAVRVGFDKALTAIVDSNLTSLLTGLILYWLGTGPIRGFAVSLSVGIVTTLFCATFLSRIFFDALPLKGNQAGRQGLSI